MDRVRLISAGFLFLCGLWLLGISTLYFFSAIVHPTAEWRGESMEGAVIGAFLAVPFGVAAWVLFRTRSPFSWRAVLAYSPFIVFAAVWMFFGLAAIYGSVVSLLFK